MQYVQKYSSRVGIFIIELTIVVCQCMQIPSNVKTITVTVQLTPRSVIPALLLQLKQWGSKSPAHKHSKLNKCVSVTFSKSLQHTLLMVSYHCTHVKSPNLPGSVRLWILYPSPLSVRSDRKVHQKGGGGGVKKRRISSIYILNFGTKSILSDRA